MKDVSASGSYSALHNAKVPWVAFIFLAVVFFFLQHVPLAVLLEDFGSSDETIEASVREGNPRRLVSFSMIGLLGVVGLLRRGQNSLRINRVIGWLTLFYVLWASLSVVWADDVFITFRRVVVLWMLCLGALSVGKHFSPRDIIMWIFFTTAAYLLLGIAIEIAFGTFQPMAPNYRFAGTLHPNHQGINCALLVLTGFAAGRTVKRGGTFFIVCAFVGIGFLVLTGSRTAFASGVAALLVYWNVVLSRSRKMALFFVISIGCCLLALFVGEAILPALGEALLLGRADSETSSFSGRIPMWQESLDYAERRLFQGYGYASFFTPSRIAKISASQGWGIGELHSAYLELLLGLGIVGMIAYVMIMALGIKTAIEHYKQVSSPGYAAFVAIFVFCLLDGVLETALVSHGLLSFVVMVFLAHLGFAVPQASNCQI